MGNTIPVDLERQRRNNMGRPLKTAKTVAGSEKKGAIGLNTETGEQIRMDAYITGCLLYTSPSPRDQRGSRMPACA